MCKDRQSVNSFSKLARFRECGRVFSKNLNLHLWFQTTNEPVAQLVVRDATDLLSNPLHGVDVLCYSAFLYTTGQFVPCALMVVRRFEVRLHVRL